MKSWYGSTRGREKAQNAGKRVDTGRESDYFYQRAGFLEVIHAQTLRGTFEGRSPVLAKRLLCEEANLERFRRWGSSD